MKMDHFAFQICTQNGLILERLGHASLGIFV